ncbi:MAG: AAA family ATPase [Acidobacteriia bacterium]|nr:AAA family ATPase [Terriglobia bacterium]
MLADRVRPNEFPFSFPAIAHGLPLEFNHSVTFFVGENGTGKSTLLEAIAQKCGFNPAGGNRNHVYTRHETESPLASSLRLSWRKKVTRGFFLRAESFFNFSTYVDNLAKEDPNALAPYGGRSLHQQSHGESFLALFQNKFRYREAIYLLDEPEAALSPSRQLAFLRILHEIDSRGEGQFIVATHSPILLAYPRATILFFDTHGISKVAYKDTEHFQLTKRFLNNPDLYLRHLLAEEDQQGSLPLTERKSR